MTPARTRRLVFALAHRPWLVIALLAAVALGTWAVGTRQQPHTVRVAFAEALDLVPGMDVRVRGQNVGRVNEVDLAHGRPVVELGIEDDAWPLPAGTRAVLRWGSTLGLGERRVDLLLGHRSGPSIPEGGVIGAQEAVVPTEFDQVFQTLDAPTRRNLQVLMAEADAALRGRADALGDGVETGSRAMGAAGGVLRDLGADTLALQALVREGDRLTHALGSRAGRIRNTLSVAALTFDTLARNASGVQRSIAVMPQTLRTSRAALRRLDPSLDRFARLARALAPAARRLPAVLRDVRGGVGELRATAPVGVGALRSVRRAAPRVEELLRRATPLARDLEPALAQALPVLACVRPYAPEAAGLLTNWSSYMANYDGSGHYARVAVTVGAANALVYPPSTTTAAFTRLTGLRYISLMPPGWMAGRREFTPDCGVGPEMADPSKDWQDRR
ncbi:MAG TPA: MlaD family protein [Baekduia sp.]|nr:MlaD family protein [Baekduia sp.]